jgi:hypothetical protein
MNFFEFLDETKKNHRVLYAKNLALQNKLSKNDREIERVPALQKEVFKLEAELDQEHLDHMIHVRKIGLDVSQGLCRDGSHDGMQQPIPGLLLEVILFDFTWLLPISPK